MSKSIYDIPSEELDDNVSTVESEMDSMNDPDPFDENDQEAIRTVSTHEDNADPIVDPFAVSVKPGRVVNQSMITLHTKLAHRLFYGRKKGKIKIPARNAAGEKIEVIKDAAGIIGLVRFASNINMLSDLAAADDPFADNQLLKIENRLEELMILLDEKLESMQQIIDSMDEIQIKPNFSISPVKLPLEFRTPYFGFHAARILKRYDNLVLLALAAKQVGYMLSSDWTQVINKTGSRIRGTFEMSVQYRFAGVNRNDLAANNQKARDAIEKYGELPQGVLERELRAVHAPNIKVVSR